MAASQTIRTLKLSLLADTSQFNRPLQGAQSSFDTFQAGISRAAVPATAALAGIAAAAASAIGAASDLEQTFGAVEQVFGGRAARRLDEFARDAADSLGQSRQEALGAAQQFGILGRAAGLEGQELADFAITLTELASDLAAFANTTPQDAINALGSALRGEFNPIERYGVVLNAAAVEQIALSAGLAETATEITAADQVFARFLGIIEETQIQSGQFAREQESIGAQSAIAKATLENFRVEVGEQLLPVFVEFIPFLQEMVTQFANTDPETIISIGKAIGGLALAIAGLNAALKAFSALKAVAAVLGIGGTVATVGIAAGTFGVLKTSEALDERGLSPVVGQVSTGGLANLLKPDPFEDRRGVTVNVNGFVGSSDELVRAIIRAEEAARRRGSFARPGVAR